MRTKILIFAVAIGSCLQAYAGRESHGLLPSGYYCQAKGMNSKDAEINFPVEYGLISEGYLKIKGKVVTKFNCTDRSPEVLIGDKLNSTVICAGAASSSFIAELKESLTSSEARVWQRRPDGSKRLYGEFDCY